ncbi:MAG TPA: VWA domain-containing protein [Pyrinomonadaceae bacterium]|jgi:VWFA-related protein|nr:VWA domain-containing protein [Pyrinomonadaceae bacterium]
MRKTAAALLLLAFFAVAPQLLFAQMRPRRAEPSQTTTAPAQAPTPFPSSDAPQKPGQAAPASGGQQNQSGEEVGEGDVVRVNASLVTVPVSVLDRDGRFIPGLHKEDFRIFEDGTEQQVAYFAPVEQPFTVALLIDTSGSTRFKVEEMQDAAIAFLDQLKPNDRVIVVSFDDKIRVLSDPTSDRGALRDAIRRTHTGDGTRLYDAVDLVINQQLSRVQGRKAIVLFTDGVDTTSKHASYQSTLAEAEELDAMIYPIQYDTQMDGGGGWPGGGGGGGGYPRRSGSGIGDIIGVIIGGGTYPSGRGGGGRGGGGGGTSRGEYALASEYLRALADETGGRHYDANDMGNIGQAFTNIAEELRQQYQLGYYPARQSQASERRQIKVRVKRPNLVVRARDSYLYKPAGTTAPADATAQDGNVPQSAPVLRKHLVGGALER